MSVPPAAGGVRARTGRIEVLAVPGLPEVRAGDDLAALVVSAAGAAGMRLEPFDVVVVAQKVVSKAEGRTVRLDSVVPSAHALELAVATGHDPRVVEVVLQESARVVRAERVIVSETHHGLVCANAGVDLSNASEPGTATLLPRDPDASARRLLDGLVPHAGGGPLGVVVTDTFGRPFRLHGVNVAIGVAGIPSVTPHAGEVDATGYVIRHSDVATADEIASAAELVMGKLEAVPVALVRGLEWTGDGTAAELLRDAASDMFRRG